MSTNGDLYLNTKNQTLWYNYKKKKQNNWKELKMKKKLFSIIVSSWELINLLK